ncbi:helix-turn-helix domain-containing protein [Leifsonia sp. NPDC077715]|uniref:helix-turn-helix domain-containing protein n=1 Tax=Leifsonia sp. NPDC077715 TaxID=3155539 RepID=UPI003427AB02
MVTLPPVAISTEAQLADSLLAAAFFASSGPHTAALCALNDHVLMANPRAAKCLLAADHAALWQKISHEVASETPFVTQLDVRGKNVVLLCTPVFRESGLAGVLLDFNPAVEDTASPSSDLRAVIPGESVPATLAQHQLARELGSTAGTLISGAPGTGKSHVAKHLLAAGFPGVEFAIFDAARHSIAALEDTLQVGSAVILLHADALSDDEADRVAHLLEGLLFDAPIVVTCSDRGYDSAIARMVLGRIHLPSLEERIEDLPTVADRLLQSIPGREYRLAPSTRKLLLSYSWPGNLRELATTLRAAAVASPSRIIAAQSVQLPRRAASAGSIGSLRHDERQTILLALQRAKGNKLVAADLLGIARSTLYKKLDALGEDLPAEYRGSSRAA